MQTVESVSYDIPVIYATNCALLLYTGQRQNDTTGRNDARNVHDCGSCVSLHRWDHAPVTFESPCECRGAQGKARIAIKNEPSTPPEGANAIQRVTPSYICSWPGSDVDFTEQSKRTGIENNWYGLTGGVVALKG
jgi:hypothetical protein